uniref:Uncharacterized protein n=1 Tax=Manihot esculenta TaxID=3983 RepID=A0A2C9VLV7_MANES
MSEIQRRNGKEEKKSVIESNCYVTESRIMDLSFSCFV